MSTASQQTYVYLVEQLRELKLAYLPVALFGTSTGYHALMRPRFAGAFLANPDLPERLRQGAPLNAPNKATFYSPAATGYTDYPALSAS